MTQKQIQKGNYLIADYVGNMDDFDGNYALYYERDSDPFAVVNWLNLAGHGIASRDTIEINQKTRVEITSNGSGAKIKSGWD